VAGSGVQDSRSIEHRFRNANLLITHVVDWCVKFLGVLYISSAQGRSVDLCVDIATGRRRMTPVAGPIFGPLSTRLIEGFHFEDCLISRFNFVPNPSNHVSQVLLCTRSFYTLNGGISFRRIQIVPTSFWKRDSENVFYKCSNSGQMFLRRKIVGKSFPTRLGTKKNLEIKQSSK